MRTMLCLLLALCASSCTMRETAKATMQAGQAADGIQLLIKDSQPVLANISDEKVRQQIIDLWNKILILSRSIKLSVQPAIEYCANGENLRPETTAEEAAKDPQTFSQKAALQAGKASQEVSTALYWSQIIDSILPTSLEGWLTMISVALTGSGTAGVALYGVLSTVKKYKNAVTDAVAYHKDTIGLDPEDPDDAKQLEEIKIKHADRQRKNGTKAVIDSHLTKAKDENA